MLQPLLGLCVILLVAGLISERRGVIPWRMCVGGLALQFVLAALMLKAPFLRGVFMALNAVVAAMDEATRAGTAFVFGFVGGGPAPYAVTDPGSAFILGFQALPLVIVIAALASLLYYWRVLPHVVRGFSLILERAMGIGGVLGVGAGGCIFLGMIEAPLLIRPYMERITRSELFAMMATGMSCIAGTMLMLYATVLKGIIPDALGHILTASVIHAPAALLIAGLMLPETKEPTLGRKIPKSPASGSMDAVVSGTADGLKLFWSIIATLLVFVALVKLANILLGALPGVAGTPLTLERMLGVAMAPAAWLIGVPWAEAATAGSLLGTKIVLNEFIAFIDMAKLPPEALSEHARLILTYAMCSFANCGSVGILLAGMTAICPSRKAEITALGGRALIGGVLASLSTGAVVGILAAF
ncbi:NupC/NupG family nucleoside CNT transporter [Solidesulfovibrio magneticus]|uniref:Nucleoside transporter n=1 Tax=Solidesulfovibrio magneticus (strain ATCC 700980 / DSM 13731 / RS-1) TaxID=573370 RepID=C4XQL1_SOLM1|nr:nucleoside transporter C-terminal domain-containing protein [Solidesulfovibrio magneticus]BAH75376.1 putative nucleoside transporter [Solidesulfovibrio magneticus RS-1]